MAIIGTAPNKTYQRSDGTRTGSAVCVQERTAALNNTAELADARENDIAIALNAMLMKDGGNTMAGDLPMGNHKITGLANASAATDAMPYGQFFPSGTAMLFAQTSAPTGWTKSTTHNDKALRVVSGTASSGGTTAFSTVFASRTPTGGADNHTLTVTEIPVHGHTATVTDPGHSHTERVNGGDVDLGGSNHSGTAVSGTTYTSPSERTATTSTLPGTTGITVSNSDTGGGNTHSHTLTMNAMDFAVQYVDCIIATKD